MSWYFKKRPQKRGGKARFAEAINVQPAYISRILGGVADLSLEQAARVVRFLNLGKEESRFFLLLVHFERAGTQDLKFFYETEIKEMVLARTLIRERFKDRTELSSDDHLIYTSSWLYPTIHMLVSISSLCTKENIANHLCREQSEINKYFDFLIERGFLFEEEGKLKSGKTKIFFPKGSAILTQFHTIWRIQAIQSLNSDNSSDLHFSSIYTISKTDKEELQKMMVNFIEQADKHIRPSPEEVGIAVCLDLFEIGKN